MSNFRRRLMQSLKNKEYTELEYIESTGTQYINTGITANNNPSITVNFSMTNNSVETQAVLGCRKQISGAMSYDIFYNILNNNSFRLDWTGSINQYVKINLNENINMELNANGSVIVNGTQYENVETKTGCDFNILIGNFIDKDGEPRAIGAYAKWKKVEIRENDNLVMDMIPVLDKNNVPCMYDKVNKEFYYNQGTGEFLYKEKSLFNTANLQIGYAISASGVVNANQNFNCTEFIPVNQSKYIFSGISGKTSAWNLRIHAYDENKNWIKQILLQPISVGKTLDVNFEINDETIKYIRASIANENFTDYDLITLKEIS